MLETRPEGAAHWSTRAMAKRAGMSRTIVSRVWRAFGLAPHQAGTFRLSAEPAFAAKVRDVVRLHLSPPDRALLPCADERPQSHAVERTAPVLPMRPGQSERQSTTKNRIDATSLNSQGYREYLPGLKDLGERAIPCNCTSDGYEDVIADEIWSETNGPLHYRMTLRPAPGQSSGDVFTCMAYPTVSVDDASDPEAKITMTSLIRASGAPTWVRGTAEA